MTNSTQKLQIDYKNVSSELQRNYCEITKIKIYNFHKPLYVDKKEVAQSVLLPHI